MLIPSPINLFLLLSVFVISNVAKITHVNMSLSQMSRFMIGMENFVASKCQISTDSEVNEERLKQCIREMNVADLGTFFNLNSDISQPTKLLSWQSLSEASTSDQLTAMALESSMSVHLTPSQSFDLSMSGPLTPSISGQLTPSMSGQLTPSMSGQLTPSISGQLTPSMSGQLTPSMSGQLTPSMSGQLTPSMSGQLTPSMSGQLTPSMSGQLTPSMSGPLTSQLHSLDINQIGHHSFDQTYGQKAQKSLNGNEKKEQKIEMTADQFMCFMLKKMLKKLPKKIKERINIKIFKKQKKDNTIAEELSKLTPNQNLLMLFELFYTINCLGDNFLKQIEFENGINLKKFGKKYKLINFKYYEKANQTFSNIYMTIFINDTNEESVNKKYAFVRTKSDKVFLWFNFRKTFFVTNEWHEGKENILEWKLKAGLMETNKSESRKKTQQKSTNQNEITEED